MWATCGRSGGALALFRLIQLPFTMREEHLPNFIQHERPRRINEHRNHFTPMFAG
jgi:hypothetical protein